MKLFFNIDIVTHIYIDYKILFCLNLEYMVIVNGGSCFFYDWVKINNKKISCHQTNTFKKRRSWNLKINEVTVLVALSIYFFHDWVHINNKFILMSPREHSHKTYAEVWSLRRGIWRLIKSQYLSHYQREPSLTLKCTQKNDMHKVSHIFSRWWECSSTKQIFRLNTKQNSKLQNWWRYNFSRHATERTSYINHFGLMMHTLLSHQRYPLWDVSYFVSTRCVNPIFSKRI
jgi:hypothetical protein